MLTTFGYISMQWIWLGLVVFFALVELHTYSLTTVWLAIAALVMVFLSLLLEGLSLPAQLLIFLAISAVLLVFTRPLAVRKFRMGKTKTNVDGLAGMRAPVAKTITEFEKGEVKVNGQVWSAVSDDGSEIVEGSKCEILRVEGVKLVVRQVQ
ncbi:MAG: NfeD family protein [Treponema sp.]|nr:NfeD family protein [Treponema sp.]